MKSSVSSSSAESCRTGNAVPSSKAFGEASANAASARGVSRPPVRGFNATLLPPRPHSESPDIARDACSSRLLCALPLWSTLCTL